MHANYSPLTENHWKAYNEHRTAQALELSRFVSSTSDGADVVFVAGDLNSWPQSLQIRCVSDSLNSVLEVRVEQLFHCSNAV